MGRLIRVNAGKLQLTAELNDSPTARAIHEALPIRALGSRWGDEIYFEIPVDVGESPDATADVDVGDLGYWPPGKAFCVFFGRTPASSGEKPRAASAVNPIGRVLDEVSVLKSVPSGTEVRLEKA